jgi:pimeloyl-ACP methyl ester carboxylesterase
MQGELSGLSSNTTRLTARGGHMIPVEQPELIVQAIIDLVEQHR